MKNWNEYFNDKNVINEGLFGKKERDEVQLSIIDSEKEYGDNVILKIMVSEDTASKISRALDQDHTNGGKYRAAWATIKDLLKTGELEFKN